jgi:hypothetical protein
MTQYVFSPRLLRYTQWDTHKGFVAEYVVKQSVKSGSPAFRPRIRYPLSRPRTHLRGGRPSPPVADWLWTS